MIDRLRALLLVPVAAIVSLPVAAQPIAITGGTIIDGNGGVPIRNGVIVIEGARIAAVGGANLPIPRNAKRLNAAGKYVIPGMMDANVHLIYDISPEFMLRFGDRFEDVIKEGTQVALKNGFTTLFDTWGPLEPLKSVRDQIRRGETQGARLYVAGNIIGLDGPLSSDFFGAAPEGLSGPTIERINAMWEQGVGKALIYMAPQEIRQRIHQYVNQDIDFLKIGVSAHGAGVYGFFAFSTDVLASMVEEARARGIPVQTHTMTADALRIAALGGFDLAQHCGTAFRQLAPDAKVLETIPDDIVRLVVDRKLNCTLNAYTVQEIHRRIGDAEGKVDIESLYSVPPRSPNRERAVNTLVGHLNERNLIQSGATISLSTDAGVPWIDSPTIHRSSPCWRTPDECLHVLGTGHMAWFKAMHEMGMPPMQMLQAATRNVAIGYRKLEEIGTLEPGKFADLVILDGDPLADYNNYRKIHLVLKEGRVIDRDALPVDKVLTPLNAPHYASLN